MDRISNIPVVQEFGRRYSDAWNSQDPEALAPLLDDEIRWVDPALTEPAQGIPSIQAYLGTIWRAFPDYRIEFLPWLEDPYVSVDGGAFAASWISTGTFDGWMDPPGIAPTGRTFSLNGIDIWRFRDGRLWTVQSFYDLLGLCHQIGVLPARGSAIEQLACRLQSLRSVRLTLLRKGA